MNYPKLPACGRPLVVHESIDSWAKDDLEDSGYNLRISSDANLAGNRGASQLVCPDCNNRTHMLIHFLNVPHRVKITGNGFEIDNLVQPLIEWMLSSDEVARKESEWAIRALTTLDEDGELPLGYPFTARGRQFNSLEEYADYLVESREELAVYSIQCPVCESWDVIPFWEMIEYRHPDTCPGCILCGPTMQVPRHVVQDVCRDCPGDECMRCAYYSSRLIYEGRIGELRR